MSRIRSIPPEQWRKDSEAWGRARTYLYVVQEEESCSFKVGIAGHPVRRLMTLQTGNPRRLFLRAVFEATEGTCASIEGYVLRYYGAFGNEWIYAERLKDVTRIITAFEAAK